MRFILNSTGKEKFFFLSIFFSCLVLWWRLADLQVFRGEYFITKSQGNRIFTLSLPAQRGVIFDRFGLSLAENKRKYYLISKPAALYSEQEPLSAPEALQLIASDESRVLKTYERSYPFGKVLAHVIGYISSDELIGQMGLEKQFERKLQGLSGEISYEINALAQKLRIIEQTPAQSGANLQTTLDAILSQVAAQALGDKKGVVLIGDAKTGAILTLNSSPSFDPNVLVAKHFLTDSSRQARNQTIADWFADERQLFFNRASVGAYPPGSVFKLVTALAALQEKKIDESTTVLDEGVLKVGDYEYGNWYYRQYGRTEGEIGLVRAISRSNDIFFYKAAELIGPTVLANLARQFGLGEATGIELPNEATGRVPDPAWKEQTTGERWFLGNTYHFGIGQGDLLVTPLQILELIQTLANNGVMCQPHLSAETEQNCHQLGISEADLNLVLKGMLGACSSGGTAYKFFPHNDKYYSSDRSNLENLKNGAIACKTGTAEFGGVDENGHRNTHAWWAGMLDLEKFSLTKAIPETSKRRQEWGKLVKENGFPQRLVFVVLVESDEEKKFREGSEDAAPVAKSIIDWILEGKEPEGS